MRAKGDWGCRPFPLMQSPSPCPRKSLRTTDIGLNSRYNPRNPQLPQPLSFRLIFRLEKRVPVIRSPARMDYDIP